MAIISISAPTTSGYVSPFNLFQEWGAKVSAAIQAAGLAKTRLEGFPGIFSRISRTQQATAASLVSPAFQVPTNIRTNDFMLVAVSVPTSGTTITTPAGWSLIRTDTATGGTGPVSQSLFYRVAAGTAGQLSTDAGVTVTFTLSAVNVSWFASFVAYGGVSIASPINVQGATSSTVNGTTATAGALTTTAANTFVVQIIANEIAAGNFPAPSLPASYRARCQQGGQISSLVMNGIYDIVQAAAGTTGTPTSTVSSGAWIVQTIALAPAVSGANVFTPTATAVAGGSLSSGTTYYYRVSATNAQGETVPCPEVSAAAAGANLSIQLSWTQVPLALGYKVYGRTTGAELLIATITSGATTTYTDTGAVTPSGALNATDTSMDTGQIEWGIVITAPTAWSSSGTDPTSVLQGYDIFQFTDSLQTTAPIFIRIDYGMMGGPDIWFRVGTATTGAGSITANPAFPNSQTVFGATGSWGAISSTGSTVWGTLTNAPLYVDSDGGSSISFIGWVNPPGTGNPAFSGWGGVLERSRNWDGTPNANSVTLHQGSSSAAIGQTLLLANATVYGNPVQVGLTSAPLSLAPTSGVIGATTYVLPAYPLSTPVTSGPSKHVVLCVGASDIPPGQTFTTSVYGRSTTYMKMNVNSPYCGRIA